MSAQAEQPQLNLEEPDREAILKEYGDKFRSGAKEGHEPGKPVESRPAEAGSPAPAKTDQPAKGNQGGAGDAAPAKPAVAEPFDGFNDLKPEQQAKFRSLLSERDQYKSQYTGLIGRVPAMQREVETLRQQLARPQTEATQAKVAATLKKFEEYKSRFPEDAEAIQELTDSVKSQLTESTNPLTDKVAQLEARVSEYDAKLKVEAAAREADRLSQEHPAWRRIAGWEDDQGNYVADPNARQWHPWFTAWKAQLPPEIQADYDRKLAQPNSVLIGHVLSHFERDVQQHLERNGQQQADAPGGSDVSQRRSDALRDISPRPSRSGSEPAATPFNGQPGDPDRQAVLDQFYKDFKAGRKL